MIYDRYDRFIGLTSRLRTTSIYICEGRKNRNRSIQFRDFFQTQARLVPSPCDWSCRFADSDSPARYPYRSPCFSDYRSSCSPGPYSPPSPFHGHRSWSWRYIRPEGQARCDRPSPAGVDCSPPYRHRFLSTFLRPPWSWRLCIRRSFHQCMYEYIYTRFESKDTLKKTSK